MILHYTLNDCEEHHVKMNELGIDEVVLCDCVMIDDISDSTDSIDVTVWQE